VVFRKNAMDSRALLLNLKMIYPQIKKHEAPRGNKKVKKENF
jgi:hypothetical protein